MPVVFAAKVPTAAVPMIAVLSVILSEVPVMVRVKVLPVVGTFAVLEVRCFWKHSLRLRPTLVGLYALVMVTY